MGNLETAQALLENLMDKIKEHKELESFVRDWRKKNKGKSYWEEKDIKVRDKLERYERYYPTQMEQQIVIIRRLLNEGKREIQITWRYW